MERFKEFLDQVSAEDFETTDETRTQRGASRRDPVNVASSTET